MSTFVVTGAAGSIGSIVCRSLVAAGHFVLMYDNAETPLFWLARDLPAGKMRSVVGSVTEADHVARVIKAATPAAVIHCAALKHVRMSQANVCEAVLVNVGGTRNVAMAALAVNARMVLVSTDKAVEPTTHMGATKKLAERWVSQYMDARIVRLVNVWGSAGSLVQVVRRQIAASEPITVSDPAMRRFFMSAEQAAYIITAEAEGPVRPGRGHVVVPGQVVERSVMEVIDELIAESGRPAEVQVVGAAPGEKLAETLATGRELARRIDGPDYATVMATPVMDFETGKAIRHLLTLAAAGKERDVENELFRLTREGNANVG